MWCSSLYYSSSVVLVPWEFPIFYSDGFKTTIVSSFNKPKCGKKGVRKESELGPLICNLREHTIPLGILLKCTYSLVGLGQVLRFWISNKGPDEADTAGAGTTLWVASPDNFCHTVVMRERYKNIVLHSGYECVNRTRARQVRQQGTKFKEANQSKCWTDTPEGGCLAFSLPWFVSKLILAIEFETWVNIEPKSMPIFFLHMSSNVTAHYKAGVLTPLQA